MGLELGSVKGIAGNRHACLSRYLPDQGRRGTEGKKKLDDSRACLQPRPSPLIRCLADSHTYQISTLTSQAFFMAKRPSDVGLSPVCH